MDHICFHGVVSSNEAVSRLLANSILLCDIKDYHSMRAEKKKKNHSETAQREELLGTERTINSNLYLMSKRTEHEQKKKGPRPTGHWFHNEVHQHLCRFMENGTTTVRCVRFDIFAPQEQSVTRDRRHIPLWLVWIQITASSETWNPNNTKELNAMFWINKNHS